MRQLQTENRRMTKQIQVKYEYYYKYKADTGHIYKYKLKQIEVKYKYQKTWKGIFVENVNIYSFKIKYEQRNKLYQIWVHTQDVFLSGQIPKYRC